jgi:hypothetical protein
MVASTNSASEWRIRIARKIAPNDVRTRDRWIVVLTGGMARPMRYACSGFIILLLAACSGPSNVEQTLVAENQSLSTQIADIRATATVAADRLQITQEYVQTEVSHVDDQNLNLVATLIERGTPTEAIGGITPFTAPNPLPTQPADAVLPALTEEAVTQNTNPQGTPEASTPASTATVAGPPRLSNIVTAEAVDANDCAVNPTSTFSTGTEQIYVVAVAAALQPGSTVVTSRWRQEGTEVVTFDFSPEFGEGCLWFFIDQTDITFTPGNWSVELEINGGLVGAPLPFTIVDEAASG